MHLSRFLPRYRAEVTKRLQPQPAPASVSAEDIAHLPWPVQKYLRFAGAVGKPRVYNFRVFGTGTLFCSPGSRPMKIATCQYNFINGCSRLYYIRSSLFGIPFDGLHAYTEAGATMEINAAYFIPVVRAGGEEMDVSETVTLFNDMCLLAPATLIDPAILWEPADPLSARAVFTHNGIAVSSTLHFSANGELVSFVSDDRYMTADGKTYARYPWSTMVKGYRDAGGRKVPVDAEATWKMPETEFTCARFTIGEIEYNCTEFR